MAVDLEKIKDAFSKFEEDDFVNSKEIIQDQINKAKYEYLQTKLGLKGKKEK